MTRSDWRVRWPLDRWPAFLTSAHLAVEGCGLVSCRFSAWRRPTWGPAWLTRPAGKSAAGGSRPSAGQRGPRLRPRLPRPGGCIVICSYRERFGEVSRSMTIRMNNGTLLHEDGRLNNYSKFRVLQVNHSTEGRSPCS